MSHSEQKSFYYKGLAYLFLFIATMLLLISSLSALMQKNARTHPIQLLSERHKLSQFLLTFPPRKHKTYFVLGLTSGILSGICFGAAMHRHTPKNPK